MHKDLDRKAELVLEAVYELGGEANTSEIKEYTGIEKNGIISYRYDKLEDAGLIETRTVDTGDTLTVTIAELTDDGRDEVGAILEDGQPTLSEQVTDLREIVRETHSKVERFEGHLDAVEDVAEDAVVVDDLAELREGLRSLNKRVEDVEADLDGSLGTVESRIDRLEHFQDEVVDVLKSQAFIQPTRNEDGSDGYQAGETLELLRELQEER